MELGKTKKEENMELDKTKKVFEILLFDNDKKVVVYGWFNLYGNQDSEKMFIEAKREKENYEGSTQHKCELIVIYAEDVVDIYKGEKHVCKD